MNLDIDLLRTFIAITERGSHALAADEVNKTQSAVSMQMKRLEEALGRPLFTKKGRNNVLTKEGNRLLDYAYRLTQLNDEAVTQFSVPELAGVIRFGTADDYSEALLTDILGKFTRRYPNIRIEVECRTSQQLSDSVKRNELDLAVITAGLSELDTQIVRREPLIWVAAQHHRTEELTPLPVALSNLDCAWRDMTIQALEKMGKDWCQCFSSNSTGALIASVTAGLAIAAIPAVMLRPDLRVLGKNQGFLPVGSYNIGVIRATSQPNPAIDTLADYIAESFGNLSTTTALRAAS